MKTFSPEGWIALKSIELLLLVPRYLRPILKCLTLIINGLCYYYKLSILISAF